MADTEVVGLDSGDELVTLKARADLLGVGYHPSIKLDKLREKVNAAVSSSDSGVAMITNTIPEESTEARRNRKRKEAIELVRVRITCMNPAKKEWDGEIISSGNSLIGTFTKFVPFNAEEGYHLPRVIYEQLVERQCQIFVSVRDARGNTSRKGKLIKEFSIEVLPPLTPLELKDLAQRQAVSKSIA